LACACANCDGRLCEERFCSAVVAAEAADPSVLCLICAALAISAACDSPFCAANCLLRAKAAATAGEYCGPDDELLVVVGVKDEVAVGFVVELD
jgi:hypothetical protein